MYLLACASVLPTAHGQAALPNGSRWAEKAKMQVGALSPHRTTFPWIETPSAQPICPTAIHMHHTQPLQGHEKCAK